MSKEFERVDIATLRSFPPTCPAFTDKDIPLRRWNSRWYIFFYRTDKDAVRRALPPPLEYISDIVEFWWSWNPVTTCAAPNGITEVVTPFGEAGITIPAKYKDYKGGYFAYMWLNSDLALIRGREIWGYPKYFAQVDVVEYSDNFWMNVVHNRCLVASAKGKFTNKDFPKPFWLEDPEWGRFVWRTITEPDGSKTQHVLVFQEPTYKGERRIKVKQDSIRTAAPEDFDLLIQDTPYVNPATVLPVREIIGLFSFECDLVVPYSKIVWSQQFEF